MTSSVSPDHFIPLFSPSVNWDNSSLLWLDTEYIQKALNKLFFKLALQRGRGGVTSPDFVVKQTSSNLGSLCSYVI